MVTRDGKTKYFKENRDEKRKKKKKDSARSPPLNYYIIQL